METDNNKLIADFMGYKIRVFKNIEYFQPTLEPYVYLTDGRDDVEELQKFHTSWDWLMPVIEKIESLLPEYCNFTINKKSLIEYNNIKFEYFEGSKIENTYKVIVEFIKWHNNQ